MRNLRHSYGLLLALVISGHAACHDTWLRGVGSPPQLQLTSGMDFPAPQTAIQADRLATAQLYAGSGKPVVLSFDQALTTASTLTLPAFSGIALVTVRLQPRTLELEADEVVHYLDELAATESVRASYAKAGHWRERYTKYARTLLRVDGEASTEWLTRPIGKGLEIVPLEDPTQLSLGRPLRLCVFQAGKPLAAQRLGLVYANTDAEPWVITEEDGCASVRIEATGATLVRTIVLRPSRDPKLDWDSDFATLTFATPHAPAPAD